MKRNLIYLLVIIVLALGTSACGAEPADAVACPAESGLVGTCRTKIGTEQMVANSPVPVGMGNYSYTVVTAPAGTKLYPSVTNGEVKVEGAGTNIIKLTRSSTIATVNITAECPSECPVEVIFTGYGQP